MQSTTKLKKSSFEKLFIELNRDESLPLPPSCRSGSGTGEYAYKASKKTATYYSKKYDCDDAGPRPLIFGEKISADFYSYLSREIFFIPKTRFNLVYLSEETPPSVSICAKWVDNLKTFADHPINFDGDKFVVNNPFSSEPKILEVKGYLRLLIIAHFLNDGDVGNQNAGITINSATGEPILVKIDPGQGLAAAAIWGPFSIFPPEETESHRDLEAMRNIKNIRLEFANVVNDIVNLTDEQIRYLIKGDGGLRQFNTIPFTDKFFSRTNMTLEEYQEKLIARMILRRNDMNKKYAEDLQWLKSEMKHALLPPLPELIPQKSSLKVSTF